MSLPAKHNTTPVRAVRVQIFLHSNFKLQTVSSLADILKTFGFLHDLITLYFTILQILKLKYLSMQAAI